MGRAANVVMQVAASLIFRPYRWLILSQTVAAEIRLPALNGAPLPGGVARHAMG